MWPCRWIASRACAFGWTHGSDVSARSRPDPVVVVATAWPGLGFGAIVGECWVALQAVRVAAVVSSGTLLRPVGRGSMQM